jgi:hypothetical protein
MDECILCNQKYTSTQKINFGLENEDIDVELKICECCIEKFLESVK